MTDDKMDTAGEENIYTHQKSGKSVVGGSNKGKQFGTDGAAARNSQMSMLTSRSPSQMSSQSQRPGGFQIEPIKV